VASRPKSDALSKYRLSNMNANSLLTFLFEGGYIMYKKMIYVVATVVVFSLAGHARGDLHPGGHRDHRDLQLERGSL